MTNISREPFGTAAGKAVDLYTMTSSEHAVVKVSTLGGTIISWTAPDKTGRQGDIVLGFNDLAGYTGDAYLKAAPYFGAIIGRYGNRIGGAKFNLDGHECRLAANNGPANLHGGPRGFDKVVWDGADECDDDVATLTLEYTSPDGDQGFPGKLAAKVVYTLTGNTLAVDYFATTSKTTICNLTQHTYFNLSGEGSGSTLETELQINAARFTPVDQYMICTGELRDVAGTPFDFRKPIAIGAHINDTDEQIKFGGGFDHNWAIDRGAETGLVLAATAYDAGSGRVLEVLTTEPGVQFYSGNFLDGSLTGKSGRAYGQRSGFCLETQHYPDSPNKPAFPSTTLEPGQTYHSTTVFKFSVK